MAEYIKILEYCEQTGLNKSKVYRAINSGKIKTKKIDGVMFINVSLLPDKFKLPEKESNVEPEKIIEKVEIEAQDTKCEVMPVENDLNDHGYITIKHYEILQELYNKLETRTQVALDAQDDSIKILKNEISAKNEEIERLLQENKKFSEGTVAVVSEDIEQSVNEKQQKIEELESLLNEKQQSIEKLENELIPAQDKVTDLENQLSELQTKVFELESVQSEIKIDDEQVDKVDQSYVDEMENQLGTLRRQLDSYQQELAAKQKIIDEHQMSQKRDEFVTVLGGINDKLSMPEATSINSDEFDKIIFEKQSKIDELENELSVFKSKVSSLEKQLMGESLSLEDHKEEEIIESEEDNIFDNIPDDVVAVNNNWEELLNEKQKIIYDLENQLFEKQQRILSFDNTNKAQREINRLLTELDVSNGKVKKLQEENKRLMYEIPNQEGMSIDVQQRFTFYHNEMTDLQSKIHQLELELREKTDIIKENDAIIQDKELRIKDIQDIADKRKNRIDDLKKELVSKHLKISQMGETPQDGSLIPDLSSAGQGNLADLQKQLSEKDKQISHLEAELEAKERMIPSEGFGSADSVIAALKEELDAAKMLLSNNGDSETIEKLSNSITKKDQEISELSKQLEELQASINDQSLISYGNEVTVDIDNNKDEKIEFLETDLKSKIEYIEMLEKTLNNMEKKNEGLINSDADEKVERLTQELAEKDESISQLECKLQEMQKMASAPELITSDDYQLDLKNELQQKTELIESLEKQLEDVRNLSLNLESPFTESDNSVNDSELQNKIGHLEHELKLKSEQILELESKLVFDLEPVNLDESEMDSKIKTLELQIDSLIEDNNRKSQLIEELQYGQSTNMCDKTAFGLQDNDSDLEIEKLRMVNDQMKNAMDAKDSEIIQLKHQLENLETDLNEKVAEIKKERQKTISIALSKSKGSAQASDDESLIPGPDAESDSKVKSLELEIVKLNDYIDTLKHQNLQLKQQTPMPQPPMNRGSDDDSGGWLTKL